MSEPGDGARPGASASGSTASPAGRRASATTCGSSSSPPRRCSWSRARRRCGGRPSTNWRPHGRPRYADALDDVHPDAPAAQQPAAGDPRGGRLARRAALLGRDLPRRRRRDRRRAPARCWPSSPSPLAAAHAEIAPEEAAESALGDPLRDERPGTPRRVAPGRAGPAPGRDRRQGGLERLDARRPAPRRPGLRAGRPRPGRVRLARPAADGDPRVQARRAGPPDGPRRTTAAAPARRRLLRARPRPPGPPRPPDRRAAAGIRHDDDPDDLDPALRAIATSWEVARRARRRDPARRPAGRRERPGKRPMVRLGDLIPEAARALGLDDELRLSRAMATFEALVAERVPAVAGRLPGRPVSRASPWTSRRTPRSSPRSCGSIRPSSWPPSSRARAGSACANCGSTCAGRVPAYNPRTCQPFSGRTSSIEPGSPSLARSRSARPRQSGARRPSLTTRGPHGRPTPDEARRRRRARPPHRLARHARRGRADRRFRRPLQGPAVPAGHLAPGVAPRARGDAPRRRDDPQRVLLRRIGRDPGLPPEGDHDRQQAARPPGRPAGPQVDRRQRARSAWRWPSSAATRCTSRPSGRRRPTSSARRASRPCPTRSAIAACRRASWSRTSGAARSRSATRSSSISPNVMTKLGVDELKDAMLTLHPQSAMEHLHHRFVAADGSGSDGAIAFEASEVSATSKSRTLVPVKPAEPLAGAPDRSPIPLADNVAAAGSAVTAAAGSARVAAGGAMDRLVARAPGPHAPPQAGLPPRDAARHAPRDPAPGGDGGPRPHHRRRRARPGRLRLRRLDAGHGDQLGQRRPAGDRRRQGGPGQGVRSRHRPRGGRPEPGHGAPDATPTSSSTRPSRPRSRRRRSRRCGRRSRLASTGCTASSRSPPRRVSRSSRPRAPIRSTCAASSADPTARRTSSTARPGPSTASTSRTRRRPPSPGSARRRTARRSRRRATSASARRRTCSSSTRRTSCGGGVRPTPRARARWSGSTSNGSSSWGDDIRGFGTFLRDEARALYNLYVVDPSEQQILAYSPSADGGGFPGAGSPWLATPRDVSGMNSIYIDGDLFAAADGRARPVRRRARATAGTPRRPDDTLLRPAPVYSLVAGGLGTDAAERLGLRLRQAERPDRRRRQVRRHVQGPVPARRRRRRLGRHALVLRGPRRRRGAGPAGLDREGRRPPVRPRGSPRRRPVAIGLARRLGQPGRVPQAIQADSPDPGPDPR